MLNLSRVTFPPTRRWAGLLVVTLVLACPARADVGTDTAAALPAPPVPAAPTTAPREPAQMKVGGESVYVLGFDILSAFPYTIVDAGTGATPEQITAAQKRDQVPNWVKFYDGKRVALTGFMMPLQMENGRAKKFVMMKDLTTCCYGAVPSMNDYVVVAMKGEGVTAIQDVPVVLTGSFKIEEKYESGYITALFSMDGEKFLGPPKK